MSGIKLDGIIVAKKVKESVKKAVTHLKNEGVEPCLATVLVDDAASAYVIINLAFMVQLLHFLMGYSFFYSFYLFCHYNPSSFMPLISHLSHFNTLACDELCS